jgi:EpsI family protein
MMSTNRPLLLQIVVLAVLSLVYVLPSSPDAQPTGISLELPDYLGEWIGEEREISKLEIQTLGPGTDFARKAYTNNRGDRIYVSIVLAGHDMNTSIHRPERCLPAQGWALIKSAKRNVPLDGPDGGVLPVKRLHNVRPVIDNEGNPVIHNGKALRIFGLNYYWFAGFTDTTNSHYTRTYYDIRDRILKGYNQRWAYITVAANITEGFKSNGLNEKQSEKMVMDFIRKLVPEVHGENLPGGRKTD